MALEIDQWQITDDKVVILPDLQNNARITPAGIWVSHRGVSDGKGGVKKVDAVPVSGMIRAKGPNASDKFQVGDRVIFNLGMTPVQGWRLNREEGYLVVPSDKIIATIDDKEVHIA